jgi:5-methylcytosine-specific restriction protein A
MQGGISTPAEHPIILLFTGEQGEEYGYRDGWTEEGLFLFTGEGQIGHMSFIRGNEAIRDHIDSREEIYLFEYESTGHVRFISQMVCIGYEWREAPDRNNALRNVIVFHLTPLEAFDSNQETPMGLEANSDASVFDQLRSQAYDSPGENHPPRESLTNAYHRSAAVRSYVLERADGICEGCGSEAPFRTDQGRPYLEPHHIQRLSDGGPDHPEWVAALCPNCHKRSHFSQDRDFFNRHLREAVLEIEQSFERT